MKNNIKVIICALMIVLSGVLLGTFVLDRKGINNDLLVHEESRIEKQDKLHSKIKTSGYTVDNPNIVLDPYDISPLTALVIFDTKEEVSPIITVMGKDKNSTITHEFNKDSHHVLPIYGLYPDTDNKVIIDLNGNKKEINIKTNKLPDNFVLPTSTYADKDKLDNELYFVSPSGLNRPCAYDVNGDVRWYLDTIGLWENSRLSNGHIMIGTDRLANAPYYTTGIYEIDLLGRVYNEYKLPGGYHHDYYEMENGNLLVASNQFNNPDGTVEDYVVELDRKTGEIVKEFDLKKILKMTDSKSENWVSYDWFHNNSVWFDKKTNSITLSGRHQDAVINIDYDTSKLNWIIGDPTNWSKEYQKYFFKPVGDNFEWQWSQHAAMITPEGYVFILDNGNNKSKIKENYVPAENSYTRGVMYEINTKDMTIKQVWEYGKERGSSFYSPYISDVDYLDKNHYIVHSGGISYVDGKISNQPAGFLNNPKLVSDSVEILNNKVIYELVLPTNNYRIEKMNLYYDNERNYNNAIDKKVKVIGTLGETKKNKQSVGVMTNSVKPDKQYDSYDIKLINENDRLNINAKFKKDDKVEIILYNNLRKYEYDFQVTRMPYTVLCVDILTDEEKKNGLNVNKYINYEGLHGKYSIYINVNDKLYNTGKYIEVK